MSREAPAKSSNLHRRPEGYVPDATTLRRWKEAIEDDVTDQNFHSRFRIAMSEARAYAKRAGVALPYPPKGILPAKAATNIKPISTSAVRAIARNTGLSLQEVKEMTAKGLRRCHLIKPAHWGLVRKGQTHCDACQAKRAEAKSKTAP